MCVRASEPLLVVMDVYKSESLLTCVPACYFIHLNKNLIEQVDRVCLKRKEAGGNTWSVGPKSSVWAKGLEQAAPCCLTEENYALVWQHNLWCHWDCKSWRNPFLTALINLPSYSAGSAYRIKTHWYRHAHTYMNKGKQKNGKHDSMCIQKHLTTQLQMLSS